MIRQIQAFLLGAWAILLVILDTFLITRRDDHIHGRLDVLIVRLDAIGDYILWVDAAKELRKLYPPEKYRITLLGNQAWTSLAIPSPHFDDVLPVDRKKLGRNIFYRFGILSSIRNRHFNIAIEPTMSRELLYGDSLVRASAASCRIGTSGDISNISRWWKRLSDRWYTQLLPVGDGNVMELVRNAEFMRKLGLGSFKASIPDLPASDVIPSELAGKSYYVLSPGAGKAIKRWKVINFAEVARLLYRKTGWLGVICGGSEDEPLGRALVQLAGVPIENWCGRTSLHDIVGIIAKANLLVSNDTSAVHIAAAVSTPSVCIVGGGHYGRFLPYDVETQTSKPFPVTVAHHMECFGCNWKCIYRVGRNESSPCIENITVTQVWDTIERVLLHHPVDAVVS